MRDKTARVVKLSARITSAAGIEAAEMRDIARSAYLAKADLVTSAVIEFTSVQGIMGSYYATAAGEPPRVARAIAEHYRPRFSGDAIPTDIIGQVVALSDKIDTICGLFAVGQAPTGSSDPFALRRAALGVLAILEETGLPISLVETIDGSLIIYREAGLQFDNAEVRREIIDFFITREKVALRDAGVKADTIDAVLACGIEEPIVLARRARALEAARTENPQVFDDLATAFARANNLREIGLGTGYKKTELTAVETALAEAVATAEGDVAAALADDRYADALVALAALRAPVDERAHHPHHLRFHRRDGPGGGARCRGPVRRHEPAPRDLLEGEELRGGARIPAGTCAAPRGGARRRPHARDVHAGQR